MKSIFEHIEYVKERPHHIRRRVAAAAAAVGSAFVAVVWLVTSYMTGAFAIQGSSFAMSTAQEDVIAATSTSDAGLAGAAAALDERSSAPRIEIVDAAPSTTPKRDFDQTIVPF